MNEVKKTTLAVRIRAAWRALTGKPKDSIEIGVEVKRCNECERGDCKACIFKDFAKRTAKLPSCIDCGKRKTCEYRPTSAPLDENTRINCPLWEKEEKPCS